MFTFLCSGILRLTMKCKNLVSVDISGCVKITDTGASLLPYQNETVTAKTKRMMRIQETAESRIQESRMKRRTQEAAGKAERAHAADAGGVKARVCSS